jgi:exodeoxyribonuclease V gamma subunit
MKLDREGVIKNLNHASVFFSNKLEILFEDLKNSLFTPGESLFTPRFIVVPSAAMKQWLQFKLADTLGVALGYQAIYLTEALIDKPPLLIDQILWLTQTIAQYLDIEEQIFDPLRVYVNNRPQRIIKLSQKLTYLFQRYGLYGIEKFEHAWQEVLWRDFCKIYPPLSSNLRPFGHKLHIFAHNHLPPKIFNFFIQQGACFYLLSPCAEFWSDLYGESKIYDLAQPMLVSLGKIGRDMAKMVEQSDSLTQERYHKTGLLPIQQALLNLQPLEPDASIELHVASTPLREVEILYANLLKEGVEPKDILIMAPDIKKYAPFLRAVFADKLYLDDQLPEEKSKEIKALCDLLSLHEKRWQVFAVKVLCQHPYLKQNWGEKEKKLIQKWIDATGIRWGFDGPYRQAFLSTETAQGTWIGGLSQLLIHLAEESGKIDFPDAEFLGEFLQWLYQLKSALDPFLQLKKTPAGWAQACLDLYDQFFIQKEGVIASLIEPMLHNVSTQLFYFEDIQPLIMQLLENIADDRRLQDSQVIICDSLRPMRALPAKVMGLLGMDHDAFPRYQYDSLDELKDNQAMASTADFDKYLFLEILLSYRQKCFISYLGKDPVDGSAKPPSSVLEMLAPYIKRYDHPQEGYHPDYFTGKLQPCLVEDFKLCQAALNKARLPPLFTHPLQVDLPIENRTVKIRDLQKALNNPLQIYFSDIDFTQRDSLQEQDTLSVDPLAQAKLRRMSLKMSKQVAITKLQMQGLLPSGSIFEASRERVESQLLEKQTQSYELVDNLSSPQILDTHLTYLPALSFNHSHTHIKIVGKIEGFEGKTLILPGRGDFIGLVCQLPLILISQYLGLADQWHFMKSESVIGPLTDSPLEKLKALLDYAWQIQHQPSPLYPATVSALLAEKADTAQIWDPAYLWAGQSYDLTEQVSLWKNQAENVFGWLYDRINR